MVPLKVCTPDALCVEMDGPSGRRYNFRNGVADVSSGDAKSIVKYGGFLPSLAGTAGHFGYRCLACGFRPYFKTCSRCGSAAVKDG